MDTTLYRRPLPSQAIAFSSPDGRRIFREALGAGGLEGYFPLAEQFHTQADPAFCGLGSLVVALNALGIDPGRLWKGPWRWFAEDLLDCCVPLAEVRERGVDLDELACLARCNGAEVEQRRVDDAAIDAWRAAVRDGSGGHAVIIASYDRSTLGQTGTGHYSPIGGYHEARDLVLVLDVARFKYPPHWVPTELLFRAMYPLDPATGKTRGWLVLRPRRHGIALGFTIRCEGETWQNLARKSTDVLAELESVNDFADMCRKLLPLFANVELRAPSAPAHREALAAARAALASVAFYPDVANAVGAERAEAVALLLLAIADSWPAPLRAVWSDALERALAADAPMAAELRNVRAQLTALRTAS